MGSRKGCVIGAWDNTMLVKVRVDQAEIDTSQEKSRYHNFVSVLGNVNVLRKSDDG